MTRFLGLAVLVALVSATGCIAKRTTTPGRGPIIQRDDAPAADHADLTRPVFGQR
jgi:hypothetical protein